MAFSHVLELALVEALMYYPPIIQSIWVYFVTGTEALLIASPGVRMAIIFV